MQRKGVTARKSSCGEKRGDFVFGGGNKVTPRESLEKNLHEKES